MLRLSTAAVVFALLVASCGGDSGDASDPTTLAVESSTTPPTSAPAPTTTTSPPTTSVATTTTAPSPPPEATLSVVGPEEVVFDWTTDRCDNGDIPDLPARAFRDASGQVNLISTETDNRRFLGTSLDEALEHPCATIYASAHDADPAQFTDSEWLASFYTEDGQTVWALIHNEYHGWERGDCAGVDQFYCWYNTITLAVSTDAGASYRPAVEPPGHLVAALPYPYEQGTGAQGLFSPSNIVKGHDGYYYALAKVGAHRTGQQSVCLMRTPDLADPQAWRFWNRTDFDNEFVDPYSDTVETASAHSCRSLDPGDIGAQMIESLTWNTYLERWVLVGISADSIDGREVWGFYYSFSDDLIDWTHRKLLVEIDLPWTVASPGSDVSYLYPSLLDPSSESRNFETTDDTAYLYYTRNNAGHASLDRDLVRVPVQFTVDD